MQLARQTEIEEEEEEDGDERPSHNVQRGVSFAIFLLREACFIHMMTMDLSAVEMIPNTENN